MRVRWSDAHFFHLPMSNRYVYWDHRTWTTEVDRRMDADMRMSPDEWTYDLPSVGRVESQCIFSSRHILL